MRARKQSINPPQTTCYSKAVLSALEGWAHYAIRTVLGHGMWVSFTPGNDEVWVQVGPTHKFICLGKNDDELVRSFSDFEKWLRATFKSDEK